MNILKSYRLAFIASVAVSSFSLNAIEKNSLDIELDTAHNQYLYGSTGKAMKSLEKIAKLIESDPNSLPQELRKKTLAFTYVRLGLLDEKQDNTTSANARYQKALTIINDKNVNVAKLKVVVNGIDKVAKRRHEKQ